MATETLRPDAAGDETSISYQLPDSGEHWEKVDEVTADEADTCVYNGYIVSYQRDLYNLPASSIPDGATINFVKIYFRCFYYSVGGWAKPSLKSDTTVTDGTEVSLTDTWTAYSQQWDTNPAGGDWEKADIDALQIGVSLKAQTGSGVAMCTQVYVEVDYTSVTNYERSATLTMGLALSASRATAYQRSASKALGLALSVSRAVTFARSATRALGLALSVVKSWGRARTASLALGLALSVSRVFGRVRSTGLALGLALSVSRAATYNRSISRALGLALSVSRIQGITRSASLALGLALSVSRAVGYARSLTKALGLALSVVGIWNWIKLHLRSRSLDLTLPARSLSLTLRSRPLALTLSSRSLSLTLKSRSLSLTLRER